jgi:hypothetical protein
MSKKQDFGIDSLPIPVRERLEKLYNSAVSFSKIGSLAEAELFMTRVQKILAEYNLEMSIINSDVKQSLITETKVSYDGLVSYGNWEVDLMSTICRYNWCSIIYNPTNKEITVIGRGDNINVCIYLYNFIRVSFISLSKISYYTEINSLEKKLSDNCGFSVSERLGDKLEEYLHKNKLLPYRRYYIRDYLAGAVSGINTKFFYEREKERDNHNMMSLIISNEAEVDLYMEDNYPNLTSVKSKETKRCASYDKGYNDGKNLKIGESIDKVDSVNTYLS